MKCESKLSEADLKPDSDLRMLKGLGKAYVARWNKLGFHTIADLAKVDRRCRKARHDLLTKLRRNRGSLTEPKLLSVLELAHRVVEAAKISDENRRAEAELTELGTQTMTTCEMELAKLGTQTMTTCEMELAKLGTQTMTTTTATTTTCEAELSTVMGSCVDMINWDALEFSDRLV